MYALADVVIFGIRSGIKLAQQARQAYLEATISRELVLPLPDFSPEINLGAATDFFLGSGKIYLKDNPQIENIFNRALSYDITDEEKDILINSYIEFKLLDDINSGLVKPESTGLTKEAIVSLLTVRQWARNRSPYPSAVQRILGTLIEIGIDFFSGKTSLIDDNTATGKAIKGFLRSIDEVDFAQERVDILARKLFIASLESIEENLPLLGADEKTGLLIESVSRALIKEISARMKKLSDTDLSLEESLHEWGQLVLRSTISSAADVILSNPATYLGITDASGQAMVASVGRSVLEIILDEDSIDLKPLFSRQSLDRLMRTALITFSEHPELIGSDHKALQRIVSQVARDLGQKTTFLSPDLFPEVARLILEKTGKNVALLWPEDARNDPSKHLLITASKEFLLRLSSTKESGKPWYPSLSGSDIIEILETVLDEVVENPDWVIRKAAEEDTVLGIMIEALFESLSKMSDRRLNPTLFKEIFRSAIKAIALRHELVEKIEYNGKQKEAIGFILDTIIETVFSETAGTKARWVLARSEILGLIISIILQKVSEKGVDESTIKKIKDILTEAADRLNSGKEWSVESLLEDLDKYL